MKRINSICLSIFILLFIPGCWDQDLLGEARLLYGGGFDLTPNGKLLSTFVIRDSPASEQQGPRNDILFTIGNTPGETRDEADNQLSRMLRTYKNRIILIGEERAKQDISPILDVFYRDSKSALNARIGVTKGRAADILSLKKVGNVLIEEEIDELIKSEEATTTVPKVTIETIYPVMLDPGEDYVLPYLIKKKGRVNVSSIAMFHKNQFTGILSPRESTMYLLLKNNKGKVTRFTQKISTREHQNNYNFITFNVEKSKLKKKILIQSQDLILVNLKLKWKVSIVEYPKDQLKDKKLIEELNKLLSKEMTHLAEQTLKKMQKARCDGLGLGRQLMAFHPDTWKKQGGDWESNYQEVQFVPEIQVEIAIKGIIN
ncbi:germination protein [Paenibacillus baekrokdamisoli]|uniref:Germination protein n=1 Tax=Paenibacillus baekrokdamisoli TaxID=1712516 RepID=A0A3G9IYJ2_9BACL|nr:Ger(x)C family spore germination protein [Paenibacillus baekrokdamisoli]MBB3069276.1 Ger(x)C family germination protein [Paenibacillus baekrokdamisoli]BBH18751.1 germination protein [Paenibacillus baekrokdamisoli]